GGAFELAVLRHPAGRGGSDWVHRHALEGSTVGIRGPRNHFRFDESTRQAIFIAGGIGITPILAMARRTQALGIDYELHYGGRSRRTMAFVNELAALHGQRLHLHFDDESKRWDLAALLEQADRSAHIYACGPQGMLEAVESAC